MNLIHENMGVPRHKYEFVGTTDTTQVLHSDYNLCYIMGGPNQIVEIPHTPSCV